MAKRLLNPVCLMLLAASLLAAPLVSAQDTGSADQLAAQARYWEQKNRFDLAKESWLKLQRMSPENPSALSGLALVEAKSGRPAAAQVYLDQLRQAHPGHPDIRKIEDAIRSGAYDSSRLDKPRGLARDGKYEDAAAGYRQAFGGSIPDGRLGLEYYQTLAGAKDGWEPARRGIEALAKSNPDDTLYQLALAQHYTYKEETRRTGIAQLSKLASDPGVGTQAQQAWRQALIWLGPKPGDEKLYSAYSSRYGQDAQVSARIAELTNAQAAGRAAAAQAQANAQVQAQTAAATPRAPTVEEIRAQQIKEAYDLLNDNQLTQASALFEDLVGRFPTNDDALGGLGIVRLRQEKYGESRAYLEQATLQAPKRAARWKEALETSRFWEAVRAAQASREAGDLARAESQLRAAIASNPSIAAKEPSVKSTLADLLVENSDYDEAERMYREILAQTPTDVNATRGLIGIMTRKNRLGEALTLAERLPPDQQKALGGIGGLRGQFLREQAKKATDAGDDLRGEQLLKQALLEDPESPWTRLDLARIYQRQKRIREANTLIDGLIPQNSGIANGSNSNLSEALFIKAMLLSEQSNWYEGLQVLEQIAPDGRTAPMAELQTRMWVHYQTERAGVFARAGRLQDAMTILQQVEPYGTQSAELLGSLASAWADVGQDGRALNFMRQALSRQSTPDPGLRLQYASLLFKLRQDAEFEVVMEELVKYPGYTQQQSVDIANLRIAYRLRQADLVREDGNLARAYEYLEPLLRVNPNDPRLVMALARLYNDAKEFDRALELYKRALQTDPNNLDAYKGAIGAALALNQPEVAQQYLDSAFHLDPRNARLYALAGRAARARGEDGRALQLFQQALRLDQESGGKSEFGEGRYTPQLYLLDPGSAGGVAPFLGEAEPDLLLPKPARAPATAVAAKAPARSPVQAQTVKVALRTQTLGVEKKKALRTLNAVRVRLNAKPVPAPRRAGLREDRVIGAMPRWWKPQHLIRVSTPVDGQPAQGTWVQNAPDRYSYSLQSPSSGAVSVPYGPVGSPALPAPASAQVQTRQLPAQPQVQVQAYAPRRLESSTQLTQPAPRNSLRDDVLREMGELTGQSQGRAQQQAQPAPVYSVPQTRIAQPSYSVPQAAPVNRAPVTVYAQPAPPQQTYVQQAPQVQVYGNNAPLGATVQDYERQGLRVLPGTQPGTVITSRSVQTIQAPTYAPAPTVQVQQQSTPTYPLPMQAPEYTSALQLRNDPVLVPDFAVTRRRAQPDQPNEVLREISDINAKRSPWVSFGLSLRNRDGLNGLDKLTDMEMPVEASVAGQSAGRIKLRAVPVFLDAGTVSGKNLPLFGAMGLAIANGNIDETTTQRYAQSESGVAVGAVYEVADLRMDFGSSPLGFPVENLVGGINWRPSLDHVSFKIDLARRSVTDSLLSYAGTIDPATGNRWGGVSKTGGRLDVAYDYGMYGIYANGGYGVLDGLNVQQNSVYDIGAGFYARALSRPDMTVTWGLNLTSFFYKRNLRRFTYGHGGYFSPQSYFAVTVPVEWQGGRERFSYKLNAALGIQTFKEDGAAIYPNDPLLQSQMENTLPDYLLDFPESALIGGYAGRTSTGIGFNFGGAFEYLIAPNIAAGARFSVDNARDYQEAKALGYLRFLFSGQRSVSRPPNLLMPYNDFGNPTQ